MFWIKPQINVFAQVDIMMMVQTISNVSNVITVVLLVEVLRNLTVKHVLKAKQGELMEIAFVKEILLRKMEFVYVNHQISITKGIVLLFWARTNVQKTKSQ